MRALAELLPLRPPGVDAADLAAAEAVVGHALPADVAAFWRVSDGSAWVDFPECGFELLRLSTSLELFALGPDDRAGPQRLLDLASDGSRERFCLDPASGRIVLVDITWAGEPGPSCGATLTEVVDRLADGWDPWGGN